MLVMQASYGPQGNSGAVEAPEDAFVRKAADGRQESSSDVEALAIQTLVL